MYFVTVGYSTIFVTGQRSLNLLLLLQYCPITVQNTGSSLYVLQFVQLSSLKQVGGTEVV